MKLAEWESKLKELSPEIRKDMKQHLIGLHNIRLFDNEFSGTGIFDLIYTLDIIELTDTK